MYEKCKTYLETLKSYITIKRLIIGALCVFFLYGIGSLASGYFAARGNYQRAIERLESTQRALDDSRRSIESSTNSLKQADSLTMTQATELKELRIINSERAKVLTELRGNQTRNRGKNWRKLEHNNRARAEIKSSLKLINGIERRNQEQ